MAKQAEKSDPHTPGEKSEGSRFGWVTRAHIYSAVLGCLGLTLTGVFTYYMNQTPVLTPKEQFRLALKKLDERKISQARELAKVLEATGFHDPSFPGGTEFILGIVAFREATDREGTGLDETSREQRYVLAADYLREAEYRSIDDDRRPEWAYALGVSLYQIGSPNEARPFLQDAVKTYEPGRIESSLLLADIYLYLKDPERLQEALALNASVVETKGLDKSDLDRACLQRAQLLMTLGRPGDAEKALQSVSDESHGNQGTSVLRAQTYMADGKYQQAMELLEPVSKDAGVERTFPRQALYLMGVCEQELEEWDTAINYFQKTAQLYERSHEAVASDLRAGDVLRGRGLHEKALESYGQALRSVRRPDGFRNKWLDLEKFRDVILQAWNDWVRQNRFSDAIALSEMMTPLFPRDEAYEYSARANQRWAEHRQASLDKLPYSERVAHEEEVKRLWNRSGQAYARLALARSASSRYADALWTSSEHYLKGHDFSNASEQLNRFINTRPTKLLPLALVRRGQALINLNHLDEAQSLFEQVSKNYATDPSAFDARYLIGQCHLERRDFALAEKTWRNILNSPEITPNAQEWRRSLFALGKLLYETADAQRQQLQAARDRENAAEVEQQQAVIFARWNEAITNIEQFLDRYPDAAEANEARYLLGKAWQRSAEYLEQKMNSAETENARTDFRRKMGERLEFANREFLRLQADLRKLQEADQLNPLGKTLLRNCYFEVANTLFSLSRHEDAIEAYSAAASRYQLQSGTLTAYVQIANCYDRLGKRAQAKSMLEQARAILHQIKDEALQSPESNLNREDWERWINWAINLNPNL